MALDATKVRVAVTGAISFAATGTTLPTNASGALDAAFKDVGYISQDGSTRAHSVDTNDTVAWQNAAMVRTVVTKDVLTYHFVMIESNDTSRELYFGNIDGSKTCKGIGGNGKRGEWVLDVTDGALLTRVVIPDGQITSWDDLVYAGGDAVTFGVTLSCYPDGSGNKDITYVA
jgi:hypothetical protein